MHAGRAVKRNGVMGGETGRFLTQVRGCRSIPLAAGPHQDGSMP